MNYPTPEPFEPSRKGWASDNSSQFANLAIDKGPSDLGITREKGLATANKETPHAPFDRHGEQCCVHRSYVFYKMGNSSQVTKRRGVLTLIRRQLIDTPKFRSPPEAKLEKVQEQKSVLTLIRRQHINTLMHQRPHAAAQLPKT